MGTTDPVLQQVIQLYQQGNILQARQILGHYLTQHTDNKLAWLWMSALVEGTDRKRECLERALAIDPDYEPALKGLRLLQLSAAPARAERATTATPKEIRETHRRAGKIGDYLVEQGLITRVQLEEALHEQSMKKKQYQGVQVPIGNILVDKGHLSVDVLATALVTQQFDKLHGRDPQLPRYLGEFLVDRGIITPQELKEVLEKQLRLRQRGTALLLGELLIQSGYVSKDVVDKMLEQQQKAIFNTYGFDE
jgi:hypothetical protein